MHIAIEGMDGVGKTSQARKVAELLNFNFIEKAFHEMKDTTKEYDNYITIGEYTNNRIIGTHGIKQSYYINKMSNKDIITDRFYVSNYWAKNDIYTERYYKEIIKVWGIPDITIILYADSNVLYERIKNRNKKDKDLKKIDKVKMAYEKMFEFSKRMFSEFIVLDTTKLSFSETTNIIINICKNGGSKNINSYFRNFLFHVNSIKTILVDDVVYKYMGSKMISCFTENEQIRLPKMIGKVGEKAFINCKNLRTVIIHPNVYEINDYAFERSAINNVRVDEGNKFYSSIDGNLYNKEGTELIKCLNQKEQVILPENVLSVGNNAFANCEEINTIILPINLRIINNGAFLNCISLEKIIFLGEKLEGLKSNAFIGCVRLYNITLPKQCKYYKEDNCIKDTNGNIVFFCGGVIENDEYLVPTCEYIYPFAYRERVRVRKLIIQKATRSVGSFAFENNLINRITLGEQIVKVGERAFGGTKAEMIRVRSKQVPAIWYNTFDNYSEIVVNDGMRKLYVSQPEWSQKVIKEYIAQKEKNMLCGTACIKYIGLKEGKQVDSLVNMHWIMEIGCYLMIRYSYSVKLLYYHSRLMEDYKNQRLSINEYVWRILTDYLNLGGKIKEKEVTIKDLIILKEKYKWIIMNVKSSLLFGEEQLRSNHFVLLEKIDEMSATIISPEMINISRLFVSSNRIIDMLKDNGQWILLAN